MRVLRAASSPSQVVFVREPSARIQAHHITGDA
ncbi:hypothetical protein LTSEINV_0008, partial [Salmonella enterica subsp. enterica serovar Inverness str. R8-3668]